MSSLPNNKFNDDFSNNIGFSQTYQRSNALRWQNRFFFLALGTTLALFTSFLEFKLALNQSNLLLMSIAVVKLVLQQLVVFGLSPTFFLATVSILPEDVERNRALKLSKTKNMKKEQLGLHPKVDLLVPCCREPIDMIQDTVRACLALSYPRDSFCVFVLDDGGDDFLRNWIEKENAEAVAAGSLMYVRRKKISGVPHYFKVDGMT
jgi:hypothetical protein